ncbi:hypothetical protein E2C01_041972 [Portunus trituberculatus]|uniref:Uncharacterized protein n=1 Tax=Portunus trituberculatus TaxID=210409 RepID=A0A5B7FS44_PORTR|nr:hypothetical protein [Portunus trituberculatus]
MFRPASLCHGPCQLSIHLRPSPLLTFIASTESLQPPYTALACDKFNAFPCQPPLILPRPWQSPPSPPVSPANGRTLPYSLTTPLPLIMPNFAPFPPISASSTIALTIASKFLVHCIIPKQHLRLLSSSIR